MDPQLSLASQMLLSRMWVLGTEREEVGAGPGPL